MVRMRVGVEVTDGILTQLSRRKVFCEEGAEMDRTSSKDITKNVERKYRSSQKNVTYLIEKSLRIQRKRRAINTMAETDEEEEQDECKKGKRMDHNRRRMMHGSLF